MFPLPLLLLLIPLSLAQSSSSLASSLGFTSTPSTLPFPAASLASNYTAASNNNTAKYIKREWDLYRDRIQFGAEGLQFVEDPVQGNGQDGGAEGLVLSVDYPAGSYSHATGGVQFYSQPLNTTPTPNPLSALLSYSLYIPPSFNFVQGGKLPGLRGGVQVTGCSGGSETDGVGCFSTRIMWRAGGVGEVYAYIPVTTDLCTTPDIICNSDYGTSLGRGSFTFQRGAWNRIDLLVRMNEVGKANGVVQLYHNSTLALSFQTLVLRTSPSLSSIGGVFFSTFFGGDSDSYATPSDQAILFKGLSLVGADEGAEGEGGGYTLKGNAGRVSPGREGWMGLGLGMGVGVGVVTLMMGVWAAV